MASVAWTNNDTRSRLSSVSLSGGRSLLGGTTDQVAGTLTTSTACTINPQEPCEACLDGNPIWKLIALFI